MRPCTAPFSRVTSGALCCRDDRDALAIAPAAELEDAVDEGKERVVAADPEVGAGIEARPTLAYENVAGNHPLAAKALDAEALGIRIPPVASRTGALLRGE